MVDFIDRPLVASISKRFDELVWSSKKYFNYTSRVTLSGRAKTLTESTSTTRREADAKAGLFKAFQGFPRPELVCVIHFWVLQFVTLQLQSFKHFLRFKKLAGKEALDH